MSKRQELLEMRLDALEQDIEKVKQVVDAAKRRGVQLDQVRRTIGLSGAVMGPLLLVKSTMAAVVDVLAVDPDLLRGVQRLSPALQTQLDDRLLDIDKIRLGLLRANEMLDDIGRTFVNLGQKDSDLQRSLNKGCEEALNKVGALRSGLVMKPLRDVWSDYETLLDRECHALFSEYVDFLGGLTLRDAALDDGVCSMTDRLLELYVGIADKSLAVPAHRGSVGDAMLSLVKIGFPDWTIWSVPLVGFDIGLGLAEKTRNQPPFKRFLNLARSEEFLRRMVADAFAVYSLGLAYAGAAVILRFQPHHDDGNPDTPSDIERAHLVLAMLRRLQTSPDDLLAVSAARLGEHWEEAVEVLTHIDGNSLDWLDDFADVAFELLKSRGLPAYDGDRFAEGRMKWRDRLNAEPKQPPAMAGESRDPLLRHASDSTVGDADMVLELLNTAWDLRLAEPSVADRVTENVYRLWRTSDGPADGRVPTGEPSVQTPASAASHKGQQ